MDFELIGLIKSVGYIGVWAIIFTECGIVFGIMLPGDTLLFTLGILARRGLYEVDIMTLGCIASAFSGNLFNYEMGKRYGLKFLKRYARRFVSDEQFDATNAFFNKHGAMTTIFARFVPIIRTIAPFLAGMVRMEYRLFVLYSLLGSLIWAGGLVLLGFYFGHFIPNEWMEWLTIPVVLIIVSSIAAPYLRTIRQKKTKPRLENEIDNEKNSER